jgi:hypothetical protein
MKRGSLPTLLIALLLMSGAMPARATSERDYAKDEYGIIGEGLSPDGHWSLAAHGDGDGGHDHFHVWLMAEPAHRRIMRLDDISSKNNLDTAPAAYHASWSPDSRHVAVSFRFDRHGLQLNLYAIEDRRAVLLETPDLFREVMSRRIIREDGVRRSIVQLGWKGPRRFLLQQGHLFNADDAGLARKLGRFGAAKGPPVDGKNMVEFAAEADGVLLPGHRARVTDLRVGKFEDD